MSTTTSVTYDRVRLMRDRAWDKQIECGDEPADDPMTDVERWWFYQGRCEAFAEVMSMLEQQGAA